MKPPREERCPCCAEPMPAEGECAHPVFFRAEQQRDARAERRMFPELRWEEEV